VSEYDFGFISPPENGKGVKVTVNKFRHQWYVHLREYMEDQDEGTWFPTKKGIAIKAEYVDILAYVFNDAGNLLTDIYYKEINKLINEKQLELFEVNEE
jgi:hypothetical protein